VQEDEAPDAVEFYTDALSGRRRPIRGKRKGKSRGPWSAAEKAMSRAFDRLIAAGHYLDGELNDRAAQQWTAWFEAAVQIYSGYDHDTLPDPGWDDWCALKDELGMAKGGKTEVVTVTEAFDVGDLM